MAEVNKEVWVLEFMKTNKNLSFSVDSRLGKVTIRKDGDKNPWLVAGKQKLGFGVKSESGSKTVPFEGDLHRAVVSSAYALMSAMHRAECKRQGISY